MAPNSVDSGLLVQEWNQTPSGLRLARSLGWVLLLETLPKATRSGQMCFVWFQLLSMFSHCPTWFTLDALDKRAGAGSQRETPLRSSKGVKRKRRVGSDQLTALFEWAQLSRVEGGCAVTKLKLSPPKLVYLFGRVGHCPFWSNLVVGPRTVWML